MIAARSRFSSRPDQPQEISTRGWSRPAIFFLGLLLAVLLATNLVVEPARFYDYETYLLYLDTIFHFRQPDWFLFEGLTKGYLLFLRAIFGTTESAIQVAHHLLLLIFSVGFFAIFRGTPWEAAAVAAALFAPQLGLVTIRATPAYMLCTIAALRAVEKRPGALRLVLLATAFHVSAFLALIPILGARIIGQTRMADFDLKPPLVLAIFLIFGGAALFFAQTVFDTLILFFEQIPYLSKYSAYAVGLADPNAVVDQPVREPVSANHYVFLGGVTLLFGGLIVFERERTLLKLFAAMSYVLYLAIFFAFSPVPAFRFAPFFALPLLAAVRIPARLGLARGIARLPLLIACSAVFVVQLNLVIS